MVDKKSVGVMKWYMQMPTWDVVSQSVWVPVLSPSQKHSTEQARAGLWFSNPPTPPQYGQEKM